LDFADVKLAAFLGAIRLNFTFTALFLTKGAQRVLEILLA
jgi:hypothetical protein